MKLRNQFLKYKLHYQTSLDAGGGGGDSGNGGTQGDAGTGGEGNANQGGENNNNDNLISSGAMWETNSSDNSNDNNNGQQQQQQQQQGPSADERFNAHIESLDFLSGIEVKDVMSALQNGDTELFTKALQQIGANAYRNTLIDTNKVIQQQMDKFGKTIKTDVNAAAATGKVIDAMNTELPFTKSPAFAPVAKLTLTQFLEKGLKPEEAIQKVGEYFKSLSGEVGKLTSQSPNSRPGGNFGGNINTQTGDNETEDDWIDFLGGTPASET